MIDLNKYRNNNGRININLAEDEGIIDIDRNPQQSMAGARTKYWCYCDQGDILYKKTLSNNYEDFGEILGYEFATLIGLPCAEYDFATFNNEQGVITRDIVGENEELIGGDEILKTVTSLHIIPIQKICLEYNKLKQKKGKNIDYVQRKKYINELINLYNNSIIKDKNINNFITNMPDNEELYIDQIEKKLEEYFEELSLLYEYRFLGYNSQNMTEEEKKEKNIYDNYFKERGFEISGWNKHKKVVVSNNLLDIWSLIDNYCIIKGYTYKQNQNIMLDLIKMFIYDIILNQGDRHISNWSILLNKNNGEIRFAPIYDNSKICILNNTKEVISQKSKSILSFEKSIGNMQKRKMERSLINIERNLTNGTDSKLMIDYDDNYKKNNKFSMIEKLLNISDEDTYLIIKEIIDKFNLDNILKIFKNIENKHLITIPDEVKTVVIKTIELNIAKITKIIEMYDERRKQK